MGLALLPCLLGERHGLRRLGAGPELHREVWLLSHRDAGRIGRYQAVSRWLTECFERDAARLRGDVISRAEAGDVITVPGAAVCSGDFQHPGGGCRA